MKKMTVFKAIITLIIPIWLTSCQLAREIFTDEPGENLPESPVVSILRPTNDQIIPLQYTIMGSAFDDQEVNAITLYYLFQGSTATNTIPLTITKGKFSGFTYEANFSQQGFYQIWAKAKDNLGLVSLSEIVTAKVESTTVTDTTPPTLVITTPTAGQLVGASYQIAGTIEDNSGGSGVSAVYVRVDGSVFRTAQVSANSWTTNVTVTSGYHTNYVYARDLAGNTTATQSVVVNYQPGTPSISISTPLPGALLASTSLTVRGTASVDGANLTIVRVKVGTGSWQDASGMASWSNSVTLSQGNNTITAAAVADNGYSNTASVQISVDSVIPTVSISSPANGTTVSNTTLLVSGTASDTGSGVKEVWVDRGAGFTKATGTNSWTIQFTSVPEGNYTVKAYSLDKANNSSATNSISVDIVHPDTQNPTVAFTTTSHTTNVTNINVYGTASDNVAVQSVWVKVGSGSFFQAAGATTWSKAVTLSSGANVIYAYSIDTSGRCSTTNSITVTYSTATGMTVYFKKPSSWAGAYIHYWPDGTTWGSNPAMTSIGDSWYSYNISDRSSSSLLFKNVAGTNSVLQTPDLFRTGDGWYWTNGIWYDTNPEDATTPSIVVNSPVDYGNVTTSSLNVSGTATGGGGIDSVYVNVNSGGYKQVTGTTSWSTNIALAMGTNIIQFYAHGVSGYDSSTVTRHVIRTEPDTNLPVHDTVTYSGRLGANSYQNGVEFSSWWRNSIVDQVWVTGSFNGWTKTALTRITSGDNTDVWWGFVSSANPGDEYKFIGHKTGGDTTVADPYSQYNRYSNGSSVVVNHTTFDWTDGAWSRPGWDYYIIYEMHVKDFTSSSSSGVTSEKRGKYVGIIEKIPYLTNLGITAVELMPISEFGDAGYSWGYETCLFLSPESGYAKVPLNAQDGVDELKELVNACHNNGIAVILDMVFNHTDNDDNWLWQVDDVAYFDYDNDGVVEAQSGGDDATPWGNRLCTWKDEVKRLGKQTIKTFMEDYHVDGFRFDATHTWFMDHSFIRDLKSYAVTIDPNVYFVYENLPNESDLKTYGAQWADGYHDTGKALFTGSANADNMSSHIYYNNSEGWAASPVESLNYVESHDESTLAYATGGDVWKQRAAAVLLATSLGNPMLWMGQEMLRSRPAQDTSEAPLDWTLLSANTNLYNYYAGVFKLRKKHPALRQPSASYFDWEYAPWSGDNMVVGYHLMSPSGSDKKFVVLLNFSSSTKTVSVGFPATGTWKMVVSETAVNESGISGEDINVTGSSYSLEIMGNSGIIYMQ